MEQDPAIVILAAGGHGKVVLETCQAAGRRVVGFLDPGLAAGQEVLGIPVLGDNSLLQQPDFVSQYQFLLGVGHLSLRQELILLLHQAGASCATVIHPHAWVSPSAVLGPGTVVMPGVVVNAQSRISDHVILNTACSVDHECLLGTGCHVAPGARLAGQVRCGNHVFVGIAAAVLPMISLGSRSVVAAGAVVIRDVPPHATVAGVPARPLMASSFC